MDHKRTNEQTNERTNLPASNSFRIFLLGSLLCFGFLLAGSLAPPLNQNFPNKIKDAEAACVALAGPSLYRCSCYNYSVTTTTTSFYVGGCGVTGYVWSCTYLGKLLP